MCDLEFVDIIKSFFLFFLFFNQTLQASDRQRCIIVGQDSQVGKGTDIQTGEMTSNYHVVLVIISNYTCTTLMNNRQMSFFSL